jgi:hypothetical protein
MNILPGKYRPKLTVKLCAAVIGLLLVWSLAAHADSTFNYELQGERNGQVEGSGGGLYDMAGRFHVTLIASPAQGETIILDFAAKTAEPLGPGQYSIGLFGQLNAGIELRAAEGLTEFDATGGSLIIHSSESGILKGEFKLQAIDMDNGGNITAQGTFEAERADLTNG